MEMAASKGVCFLNDYENIFVVNQMPDSKVLTIEPSDVPVNVVAQPAIDEAQSGLRIVLAPGIHKSAGLRLTSDTTLHFEQGAELHFFPDYGCYEHTSVAVEAEQSDRGMLVATGAERISITGSGRIFCNGSSSFSIDEDKVMGTLVPASLRPRVLVFDGCRDVEITGLRIDDSPMWTLHFIDCDGLNLSDLRIDNNRQMPNTDGVVIDGCRDVRIKGCTIRTADDGIVLKTSARVTGGTTGPCENIHASDCIIESRSCALKLGTESFAPFRNIVFEDFKIEGSNRGIGIFSRDGGLVDNVRFSRIELACRETPSGYWGSGEAVTINTVDRRPEDGPSGKISNVVIEGISGTMEGAINLFATRRGDITNITLRSISLDQSVGALGTGLNYDLRPTSEDRFPSEDAAGRVNAWRIGKDGKVIGLNEYPGGMPGVFAHQIAGLTLDGIEVRRPNPLPDVCNPKAILEA